MTQKAVIFLGLTKVFYETNSIHSFYTAHDSRIIAGAGKNDF
jgi:hypothetical protein